MVRVLQFTLLAIGDRGERGLVGIIVVFMTFIRALFRYRANGRRGTRHRSRSGESSLSGVKATSPGRYSGCVVGLSRVSYGIGYSFRGQEEGISRHRLSH